VKTECIWHPEGSKVQRARSIDLSGHTKQRTGPILTVTRIDNHRPIDGPETRDTVRWLSDGSWEFVWNLY
jgi:hypothetical protein